MADDETLKIRIDGRDYPFPSFDTFTYGEARKIKRLTETDPGTGNGLVMGQFFTALEKGDPDALVAIAFIAKQRDNPDFKAEDLDDLNLEAIEIVTPSVPVEDMTSPLDDSAAVSDETTSGGPPNDENESSAT